MKNRITLFLATLLLTVACQSHGEVIDISKTTPVELKYAKFFKINKGDGFAVVRVTNPWDTTKLLQQYLILDNDVEAPEGAASSYTIVKANAKSSVTYTSVDASILDAIGAGNTIIGACEPQYITLEYITKGVADGSIADLGQATMPNVEKLALLNPDIIIVSPFQNKGYGAVSKLGIPIVECAAYMESTVLGQSEWIKFLALFMGKESTADSLFTQIESEYNSMKKAAGMTKTQPKIMTGTKQGQTWYVAAGESYKVNMYRDANINYPWSDTKGGGSLTLSLEQVYKQCSDADYWFFKYYDPNGDMTYDKLKEELAIYANFKPFKEKKIFVCNTAKVDFYETSILNPHLVLGDFINAAHDGILPNHQMRYYTPLKQ